MISALLVPIAELAAEDDFEFFKNTPILDSDIRGDVVLLVAIAAITYVFFSGFDAPLKRTLADCGDDDTCQVEVEKANDDAPKLATLLKSVTWPVTKSSDSKTR